MARFRRLPVSNATYVIIDRGRYPTDKEYVDLGVREGWLILFRIVNVKDKSEYQYRYPKTFHCE